MTKTLRDALGNRDNALNFVRLIFAAVVIFNHAWPVGGFGGEPSVNFGAWAVNGFFAISGYLIAGSRIRLGFREFLVNRTLRIFPAFWAVLLLTAFLLAPTVSFFAGWDWSAGSALWYVVKNFGLYIFQPGIWGTLADVPYVGTWNVSLWTLFYEFCCYIFAALILTAAWSRHHPILVVTGAFALTVTAQILVPGVRSADNHILFDSTRLGAFFLAGMLVYFLGDRLKANWWTFAASIAVFAALWMAGFPEALGQVPLAIAFLTLAALLPIRLGARNDISYGLYVWAWPVQQTLATIGTEPLGPLWSGALALALTVPLAWCSWKFVEKPALNLRRRVPRSYYGEKSDALGSNAQG